LRALVEKVTKYIVDKVSVEDSDRESLTHAIEWTHFLDGNMTWLRLAYSEQDLYGFRRLMIPLTLKDMRTDWAYQSRVLGLFSDIRSIGSKQAGDRARELLNELEDQEAADGRA
jgi:hypothetical protein